MLINDFKDYVKKNLGIGINLYSFNEIERLPIFLREKYDFFNCNFGKENCIVMQPKERIELTPGEIKKDTRFIENKFECNAIYLQNGMSSYNRDRLISYKISFVIPNNQMYLPSLALDLREHFKKIKIQENNKFKASTQVVFLNLIIHKNQAGSITLSSLAQTLGYSKMTLSRAFDQLQLSELVKVSIDGRERVLKLDYDKKALWVKAQKYLVSPVKKRIFIKSTHEIQPKYLSGLCALSKYSKLSSPHHNIFAVSSSELKELKKKGSYFELASKERECTEIELWKYSPRLLSQKYLVYLVDKFSLFLSQRATNDERIEMALEELLETVEW